MAYTKAWDEAVPIGSDLAKDTPTFIKDDKIATRERLVDILDIVDFEADPIVPRVLKLNKTAESKILGGTTSLSIRNAADNEDNILILDNGDTAVRGTLSQAGLQVSEVHIETVTLSTNGPISFSSIPDGFRHLRLRGMCRGPAGGGAAMNMTMRFNGDSGSNYDSGLVRNNSSTGMDYVNSIGASFALLTQVPSGSETAGVFGAVVCDILNYSSTAFRRSYVSFGGSIIVGDTLVGFRSNFGNWRNTSAAINAIAIQETLLAGSTLSLYGVY